MYGMFWRLGALRKVAANCSDGITNEYFIAKNVVCIDTIYLYDYDETENRIERN